MTKSISLNLRAEMTGALSRLATCMKLTRVDGNVYGFTTHDKPLTINGVRYESTASFSPTDIASASTMDTDNLTVEAILSSDTLSEDELRAGYWDYAQFRIFIVNWSDLTMGDAKERKGRLGEVRAGRLAFTAELLGLLNAYTTSIGVTTQPLCRASLGDSRCQYQFGGSPAELVSGTIESAGTDFFTLNDSARTEADAFFDEGVITLEYDSGPLSYEVKAYIVGTWITKTPFAYDATGVNYTMQRGCTRTLAACTSFGNVVNFQGEPWLRGNDALLQIGRRT